MIGPVAILLAQLTVTVTASDRSEVRLRSIPPTVVGTPAAPGPVRKRAIDLTTTPTVGLSFAWPEVEFSLGYGLGISKIDLELDYPILLMHGARAAISWRASQDLTLTLSEDVSYGRTRYFGFQPAIQLGPVTPPVPGITYVPVTAQELTTGSTRTALAATWLIDARWTGTGAVYYLIAGGVDYESRLVFRRRRGPGADFGLTYGLSANDTLTTSLSTSHTTIDDIGGEFQVVAATETWGHRFSLQTRSTLGGGLTYFRGRQDATYTYGFSILPNAGAGITHTFPLENESTISMSAAANLGTGFNAALGVIQYAAAGTVGVDWVQRPFNVGVSASYSQSIPLREIEARTSRGVSTGLLAGYTPFEFITFDAGARIFQFFSDDPRFQTGDPQWALFAGVTLRAPPIRF